MTMVADMHTGLSIGGLWCAASDGRRVAVTNPADARIITKVASASPEDGIAAIDAAERAAPRWTATPPRVRGEILRKAFELMIARRDELAALISLENGKSAGDAQGEVTYAAEFFRWYAEEAVRNLGQLSHAPGGAHRIMVTSAPVGISLLITPWNFPAAMATRKIAPALAAGCTVILKPATETPLTALALAGLLAEAGVPAGVINVIPSDRSSATIGAMMADGRLRKLSFTGSTAVGKQLLVQAADTVMSCSMELGGNAPLIVLDDADLDNAVAGALVAKLRNKGESCIAANRLYVQSGIVDAFCTRFSEAMAAQKIGPLINEAAVREMETFVADALRTGAKLVCGGRRCERPGYYFQPTLLRDPGEGAAVLEKEIFGPIAPVVAFETEAEAVRLANATPHGLAGYVFGGDLARALRVAEQLECGMTGINRGLISEPAAPFGGTKQSGLGREGAADGMQAFLEKKYIAVDW